MGRDNHPMIPVPEAIRIVLRETAKILLNNEQLHPVERIPTSIISTEPQSILDRVLVEDVIMKEPGYPPYNASIMDGYAIRSSEFTKQDAINAESKRIWTHRVINKVYAGDDEIKSTETATDSPTYKDLPTAIYITTGAVVPEFYDCVVPVEECQVYEETTNDPSSPLKLIRISSSASIENRKWIRSTGCDIPPQSTVLPKGHVIDPTAIGLIKQSGCPVIKAKRKIQIGVLSTGNELIVDDDSSSEIAIAKGKIPDVNRPILLSLLSTFQQQCNPIDLGMVRDDNIDDMTKTFEAAFQKCDVIVTTGGVSMGETDIVEHVLIEKCGGRVQFGRMHMKPGKPTTFITIPTKTNESTTKLVFAMPGNPVSATVCTQLLVKPCLDLYFRGIKEEIKSFKEKSEKEILSNIVEQSYVHPEIQAVLAHDIKLDKKRPEYHRVTLTASDDGKFVAIGTGIQQSSRLMSLRDAQGLLILPNAHGVKTIALCGETYPVLIFNNNMFGIKPIQVQDSVHMKKKGKGMKVGVIEVVPQNMQHISKLDDIALLVQTALSGSKSGVASVITKRMFDDAADTLYNTVVMEMSDDVDLIVVSCTSFAGAFSYHLNVSNSLRKRLSKIANSLALQARQGAASQDPTAALFEVVVGYIPEKQGAMLICLPDAGLASALGNVRGSLKHGLNLARGKAHNHHHTHQDHDHTTK